MRQIHNTDLCFVHIPKTAGQAVTQAFNLEHKTTDHSVNTPDDQYLMSNEFIRFCVVRDPLTRFISAYTYSVHMSTVQPNNPIRKFIMDNKLENDIDDFIQAIALQGFPLHKNLHFIPQFTYLRLAQPQIILRQENLENDIRIVAKLVPEHFQGLSQVNSSAGNMNLSSIQTEPSPQSKKQIEKWYANDYAVLGYNISS